ncbi:MAG: FkbM family methyltransferase, partial [Syntrophales bacterium]|nr:FkbM family methyltransferase [Syntrophales bacterium]
MRYINLFRNLANAPLYLAVKFGLVSDDPLMFVTRTGVRVEVPRRLLQTFKEIFMDECYLGPVGLPEREGAVVVDIGANVGFFSLFCAARLRVPRIVAYEPFPANFAQLARNCRLNPMLNIYPYRCAVGGSRGEISLHYDADDTFSTSAAIGEAGGAGRDVIKVPCTTLAEIFATHEVK